MRFSPQMITLAPTTHIADVGIVQCWSDEDVSLNHSVFESESENTDAEKW